jgi:hypothetical protein
MEFISHIYTISIMWQCPTIYLIIDRELQQFFIEKENMFYVLFYVCKENSPCSSVFIFSVCYPVILFLVQAYITCIVFNIFLYNNS